MKKLITGDFVSLNKWLPIISNVILRESYKD